MTKNNFNVMVIKTITIVQKAINETSEEDYQKFKNLYKIYDDLVKLNSSVEESSDVSTDDINELMRLNKEFSDICVEV